MDVRAGIFRFKGAGEDWQIVIEKEGNKDFVELRVEVLAGEDAGLLKEKVLSNVKKFIPDAWKFYENGYMRFDVLVVPNGSLREGRKLKRLVDKRRF